MFSMQNSSIMNNKIKFCSCILSLVSFLIFSDLKSIKMEPRELRSMDRTLRSNPRKSLMLHTPPTTPKPQKKMRLSGASNDETDTVSSDVLNAVQPVQMDDSHQNEITNQDGSDLASSTSDIQTEQSSGSYVIDSH